MKSSTANRDDAPALTGDELKRADGKWLIGGREVSREEGLAALRAKLRGKVRINIHLDKDLVAYYKGEAGARGYQTLINAALRRDMERADLKADVIEEFQKHFQKQFQDIGKRLDALALQPSSVPAAPVFEKGTFRWDIDEIPEERAMTNANSVPQYHRIIGHA